MQVVYQPHVSRLRADRAAGISTPRDARRAIFCRGRTLRAGSFRSEPFRFRRWCLPSCFRICPPQRLECDARRSAPRCARHPAPRSTRRALWTRRVCALPATGGIAALARMDAPSAARCPSNLATACGAWTGCGVPRAATVGAAGGPCAQVRRAGKAWPQPTAAGSARTPSRHLLARNERHALNDARRDGRGVEVRRSLFRRNRRPLGARACRRNPFRRGRRPRAFDRVRGNACVRSVPRTPASGPMPRRDSRASPARAPSPSDPTPCRRGRHRR